MVRSLPVTTAIVVARGPGVEERLHGLFAMLIDANIVVTVVAEADEATAQLIMADAGEVQCVLVDASDIAAGDAATWLVDTIRAITAVPDVMPIVLVASPPASLVTRAFRAGAGDVIDLDTETSPEVTTILQRVADHSQDKLEQRTRIRGLRTMLDEFFRNLVKTERRTIDLERELALHERGVEPADDAEPGRPTVLIIEDDAEVSAQLAAHLERTGVATVVAASGEHGVALLRELVAREGTVDLALVDAHLPGMSGIQAIRAMRELVPSLSAVLMTGFSDTETAMRAADLGVVGYVLKPFDDMAGLVKRIKERAIKIMQSAREQHYLAEIKQRHEKILLRYRKLAAELERL